MAQDVLKTDLDLKRVFQHKIDSAILSIGTSSDGTAWIGSADNTLQLIDQSGEILVNVKLNSPAIFSARTPSGELIVSHGHSQETKLIHVSLDGTVSDFYDLAPCEAIYDVKVTSHNEVLVCKEISFLDNIGKLVKLSLDGEKIWEIGRDVLKYCPTRVTEMHDGNYCVKVKDRLMFISPEGKFIRQTAPNEELSTACTIVCDQHGFIIGGSVISDTDRQFIYLFDENGQCVKTYTLMDSARVYVLTIDSEGTFWIGKDTGQIVLARYLK